MASRMFSSAVMDLSTTSSSQDKAIVDIRLLTSVFANFMPASLEDVKEVVKNLVDRADSLEDIGREVEDYIYTTSIASKFTQLVKDREPIDSPQIVESCI